MIEITVHAETFSKDPLNRLVFSFGESYHPPLSMHLYRTAEDALHLVVTDNTTNERSIQMGRIIDDFFQGRLWKHILLFITFPLSPLMRCVRAKLAQLCFPGFSRFPPVSSVDY